MIEGIVNESEREKSMIIIGAKSYIIDTNKMPIFYPAGKKFHFIFTENDCAEIKSGRCPIEDNDVTCKCLCNEIKKRLNDCDYVQDGKFIEVVHYRGNDIYEVNDGQHRMCIAGKLKAGIKILREESNQDCAELGIGCTKEF